MGSIARGVAGTQRGLPIGPAFSSAPPRLSARFVWSGMRRESREYRDSVFPAPSRLGDRESRLPGFLAKWKGVGRTKDEEEGNGELRIGSSLSVSAPPGRARRSRGMGKGKMRRSCGRRPECACYDSVSAATASCPRLNPPSFGGTRRWRKTRNRTAVSRAAASCESKAFMNTPPLRTTASSLVDS